ncbi:MAG: holo-ACP synthase [Acidihalobacter sp.]|uniref:holo-ACP synthase n=1 Tax=Acidihalobacter sp. TaxID=1872108 RepID=UPI00307D8091
MSVRGIGVDLVELQRVERMYERHGPRAVERILHPDERVDLGKQREPARYLAKRFAAKEAGAKALGTGIAHGVRLHDIRIGHDALGRPELILADGALQRAHALGATHWHLSLSDEHEQVIAFVVLDGN